MMKVKIVFIGTSSFACPALNALSKDKAFELLGVITQPDKEKGRNLELEPPPVKTLAQRLNLEIFQPEKIKDQPAIEKVKKWNPDIIIVAAYGQILPDAIINIPKFGCLNIHASLLPKYRGAAPIQWAILNGETSTGVTIMKIAPELDAGDIIAQAEIPILSSDNSQTLHDRLANLGAKLIVETIPLYINGSIKPEPQDHSKAIYARKLTKEDGIIDWSLSATALWNKVRAFNPWPGAFTFIPTNEKPVMLKIWEATPEEGSFNPPGTIIKADKEAFMVSCGSGLLNLTTVQLEGRKKMSWPEFLNGTRIQPGLRFLVPPINNKT
jgi:methionyl-tRNA formyltransferase